MGWILAPKKTAECPSPLSGMGAIQGRSCKEHSQIRASKVERLTEADRDSERFFSSQHIFFLKFI
jgi:hypothetical protein